jgi:hypothetical protein
MRLRLPETKKSKIILLSLLFICLVAIVAGALVHKKSADKAAEAKVATPASIKTTLNKQNNKEQELRGVLVKGTNGTYYLLSPEKKNAVGIQLDFQGSGIDPTKYDGLSSQAPAKSVSSNTKVVAPTTDTLKANNAATNAYTPPTVVITGKLTQAKPSEPPIIHVESLKQVDTP